MKRSHNHKKSARKKDLTGMVDGLVDRVEAMGTRLRKTAPRAHEDWAEAAVEGLHTAMEELQAAQDELSDARTNAEEDRVRYLELFAFAPDGYLVTDKHGKILEANHVAGELFNVPLRWLPGKPVIVYIGAEDHRVLYQALADLRTRDVVEGLVRSTPRESGPLVLHYRAAAVRGEGEELSGVRWLLRDVTEQVHAREELDRSRAQLRAMAAELSRAEERERRRIAEGLHDHVVQMLALAKMTLGVIGKSVPEQQAKSFAEAMRMIGEATEDLRTLVFELSPPVLYELGLGPAVEWLADRMWRRHNLKVQVKNSIDGGLLSVDMRVLLFQAIRELLINVVKHAQAEQAMIGIDPDEGGVRVTLSDAGRGFAVKKGQNNGDGFGLFNLRNRLEQIGGTMQIDSKPGSGTRVTITAPARSAASSPPPRRRHS